MILFRNLFKKDRGGGEVMQLHKIVCKWCKMCKDGLGTPCNKRDLFVKKVIDWHNAEVVNILQDLFEKGCAGDADYILYNIRSEISERKEVGK